MAAGVIVAPSSAQTHFTRVWSGTPYLAMNLYVTAAQCDSAAVGAGDEIAVFDGVTCVGLAVLAGPIVAGSPLSVIASTDDPTTPAVDGFTVGHQVGFRIWRSGISTEYLDSSITKTFAAGTGLFASLGTAVIALSARTVTEVNAGADPERFTLSQNYPNPFNGTSEIGFTIPDWVDVRMQVFDLLGRELATLVNERKAPGTYIVRFDGGGLASGVYICRMTAGLPGGQPGKRTAVTKIIIQR
jgi:hypothetical protein